MVYDLIDGRVHTPEGLEINATYHCNLGCASCSHLSPVFHRSLAGADQIAADLAALGRSFRARFVKILGGEPLLHPELVPILQAVRASGIAPRIVVCTNGLLLPRMGDDFWDAADEVEMSVYPNREIPPEKMAAVRAMAERHGTDLNISYYTHFRYSYSEDGTEDRDLVSDIYGTCQIAHVWRCHTLYEGHFFKCPQAIFLPRVIGAPEDEWVDGLRVSDSPDFAERLLTYLTGSEPLAACRNCLGSVGKRRPHEQRRRTDFRDLQRHSTENLLDRTFLTLLHSRPDADDGCAVEDRTEWVDVVAETAPALQEGR